MSELRVHGLGAAVTIRAESREADALMTRAAQCWAWCLDGPDDAIDAGDVVLGEPLPGDDDGCLQRLTQNVTQALIRARAGQLFLLHAAALAHPSTGATVIAVAPGGTGKTTLARTFGRRYGYVTDETTGLLDDGRILPYQKPLSLRQESAPKKETSPAELGLVRPTAEPWLAGILLLTRDPDVGVMADVLELPLLDAIAAMAPETSSLSVMEQPLHRLRDMLAPVEPVLRVTYSEAAHLEPLIVELVGKP